MSNPVSSSTRTCADRVADLLTGFFSSTDAIRALPRLSLLRKLSPSLNLDRTALQMRNPVDSAKMRMARDILLCRTLRSNTTGIIFNDQPALDSIKEQINRTVEFRIDGDIVRATANTPEGYRCVRDADYAQKTVQEMGKLSERSLLLLAASVAEIFTSRLLMIHYTEHPDALGESTIPIKKIRSYENLDDILELAAEEKVEETMRKPAKEWLQSLFDIIGVPPNLVRDRFTDFDEAFARRNALIHNDGLVGSRYLARCATVSAEKAPKKGDFLEVSLQYLNDRVDVFISVLGYAGHAYLAKLDKLNNNRRFMITNDQTIKELDCDRFALAVNLCTVVENDPHADEANKLIALVNKAQSLKWSGNDVECQKTLDTVDWSTREDKFKLAETVLKDNYDEAVRIAKRCIANKQMTIDDLMSWPLFRKCRERNLFDSIMSEFGNATSYGAV